MIGSRSIAMQALYGAGDPMLGEWVEDGYSRSIVHVRRRLSDDERFLAGIPGVRDIRGTQEERVRFAALITDAPHLRSYLGATA